MIVPPPHWKNSTGFPFVTAFSQKLRLQVFKCLHGQAPQYLADLISLKTHSRSLRSSELLLEVPFNRRKTFLDRSFQYSGPSVWNSLPPNLRKCQNLDTFKDLLKTFFCNIAYDWFRHLAIVSLYIFMYEDTLNVLREISLIEETKAFLPKTFKWV